MEKNAQLFLNQIAGVKIRIKEIHWDAEKMNEHKLADDISNKIIEFEDSIAEELQSLFGKIEPGETVPVIPKSMKLKELNKELIGYTYDYYNTLKDNKLIGIKATVESFIHDLNVFDYLIDMSVNENKTPFGKLKKIFRFDENKLKEKIEKQTLSLMENVTKDKDISGNYQIDNKRVFIDDENKAIVIKDVETNSLIYSDEGESTKNLLNLFKLMGGDFHLVLENWLKDNFPE